MSLGGIPSSDLPRAVPVQSSVDQLPKQARVFQGHRAGVITRLVANVVDYVVMLIALAGAYVTWFAIDFIFNTRNFAPPKPGFGVVLLAGMAFLFLYLSFAWAVAGRTFGNLLLGLRVVNWRGEKIRWPGAILRAALCLVFIPGFFWVAISRANRSVQDILLRTSVIYDWTAREPKMLPNVSISDETPGTADGSARN